MNATNELARLQAAAERARDGYHHEEAADLYTQALEIAPSGDDPTPADPAALTQRYELLFSRGESYRWMGKTRRPWPTSKRPPGWPSQSASRS